VVFGAALRPDGSPSGVLARRIEGAAAIYGGLGEAWVIVTGGPVAHPTPEAHVMRAALVAAGVPAERILVEDQARDTLDSVRLCDAILRTKSEVNMVVPATSGFHQPRCAALLKLKGWRVRRFRMPPDRPHMGALRWWAALTKEALATPWDVALLSLRR
jgi:vancomycin permeability regulator SanA